MPRPTMQDVLTGRANPQAPAPPPAHEDPAAVAAGRRARQDARLASDVARLKAEGKSIPAGLRSLLGQRDAAEAAAQHRRAQAMRAQASRSQVERDRPLTSAERAVAALGIDPHAEHPDGRHDPDALRKAADEADATAAAAAERANTIHDRRSFVTGHDDEEAA